MKLMDKLNPPTLVEFAHYWLDTYKLNVRLNTRRNYENLIRRFDKEDCPITKVNKQTYVNLLKDAPEYTKSRISLCFKQIIRCAIAEHYLKPTAMDEIFGNIKIKVPPTKHKKRALTAAEVEEVYNIQLEPMYKAYLWIIFGCGLRREEVLALTPNDITGGCINVNKTIVFKRDGQAVLEHETKSINSRRTVPMPKFLNEFMDEYLKTPDVIKYGKIIYSTQPKTYGEYIPLGTWQWMSRQIFRQMDKDLGYKTGLSSHSFRHNYCSQLCYQIPSISINTVAELLGDTTDVVLNTYNHVIAEREDKQSAIENALKIMDK